VPVKDSCSALHDAIKIFNCSILYIKLKHKL
jgi:hypothetical protein